VIARPSSGSRRRRHSICYVAAWEAYEHERSAGDRAGHRAARGDRQLDPTAGRAAIAGIRAFVAVLLPDALREQLGREIGRLRDVAPDVAWVADPNLHVTLKFLGQIDEARVPAIADAIRAATSRAPAFEVGVRGLGAFPSPSRPRVVWAGLEEAGALDALAGEVDRALAALGMPRESRPFAAHVTLGRVREPRRYPGLAEALARPADFGRLPVTRLSLMRSDLHPGGARYTEVTSVVLARAPSPVE
jgi:2'-5' RNA ligase